MFHTVVVWSELAAQLMLSRQGDPNTGHKVPPNKPPCGGHAVAIQSGSSKVRVNGRGCGRVGDATCTSVAQGSNNVFAG